MYTKRLCVVSVQSGREHTINAKNVKGIVDTICIILLKRHCYSGSGRDIHIVFFKLRCLWQCIYCGFLPVAVTSILVSAFMLLLQLFVLMS